MDAPRSQQRAAVPWWPRAAPAGRFLGALLLLCAALAHPAAGQELIVSRNQFAGHADRPAAALSSGPAVTLRRQMLRVSGADRLRIVSPDPQVAAVLRYRPAAPATTPSPEPGAEPSTVPGATAVPRVGAPGAPAPGAAWVLYVIVVAQETSPRYQQESDGQLLQDGALVPQPRFTLGPGGLESGLAGSAGHVSEIVIQDDGDAELRLRQDGPVLELQVVPLEAGGAPDAGRPPPYLGKPLRFADAGLLGFAWTDNALAEAWLGDRFAGSYELFLPTLGGAQLGRLVVTGQLWRGRTLSLWLEGGAAAYRLVDASGIVTSGVRPIGGATLHWRYKSWGAALHAASAVDVTALSTLLGWQVWPRLGLLLGWHSVEGRSGFGLGASLRF